MRFTRWKGFGRLGKSCQRATRRGIGVRAVSQPPHTAVCAYHVAFSPDRIESNTVIVLNEKLMDVRGRQCMFVLM
ncbi:unnamed protein product [Leptosia nina]|uniref:Uncharacterized protein n=1 Tax=Leptosia nina TaxID=320188 RepID=A0AAV1JIY6_9NEOP